MTKLMSGGKPTSPHFLDGHVSSIYANMFYREKPFILDVMWHPIRDQEMNLRILAAKYIYDRETSEKIK